MKQVWQVTLLVSLVAAPAAAQAPQSSGDPLTAALQRHFETVSRNVRESAEKTPAMQVPRAATLAGMISHSNEHYGNLVPCMRLDGLVPPSIERAQQARPAQ
jgi:uncharacterized damage-inducible protein DinB